MRGNELGLVIRLGTAAAEFPIPMRGNELEQTTGEYVEFNISFQSP